MSNPKHTPGPWIIKDLDTIYDKRGIKLAYISDSLYKPGPIGGVYNSADYKEERNANARLIASAPELLASLERLFNSVVNEHSEQTRLSVDDLAKIGGVIKKARGES